MTTKTPEEIQALKDNWIKDPCWDIEDTEGFEEYREELMKWRNIYEAGVEKNAREWADKRVEKVMLETGIGKADRELLLTLHTFCEIEIDVCKAEIKFDHSIETANAELAQAQVRATLLQAAQLKRIADALELIQDGDSFSNSVKIWGSEQ